MACWLQATAKRVAVGAAVAFSCGCPAAIPASTAVRFSCSSDNDCPRGQQCVEQSCVPGGQVPVSDAAVDTAPGDRAPRDATTTDQTLGDAAADGGARDRHLDSGQVDLSTVDRALVDTAVDVTLPDATAPDHGGQDATDGGAVDVAIDGAALNDSAVNDAAINDADRHDAAPAVTCDQVFGSAPGYVYCRETATQCEFACTTGGGSCNTMCQNLGHACVGAFDNIEPNVCDYYTLNDNCATNHGSEICVCAR